MVACRDGMATVPLNVLEPEEPFVECSLYVASLTPLSLSASRRFSPVSTPHKCLQEEGEEEEEKEEEEKEEEEEEEDEEGENNVPSNCYIKNKTEEVTREQPILPLPLPLLLLP